MVVSGQLHAPAALPPGKKPLVPTGYEAEWIPEPVWTQWRREKFLGTALRRALLSFTSSVFKMRLLDEGKIIS